jgi:hypothetical protein
VKNVKGDFGSETREEGRIKKYLIAFDYKVIGNPLVCFPLCNFSEKKEEIHKERLL